MYIYHDALILAFLLCIISLFVCIIIKNNEIKNLKKEISSVKQDLNKANANIISQNISMATLRSDLQFEKISLEKAQRIFQSERIIFKEFLEKSLDQLHKDATTILNTNHSNTYYNFELYPELQVFLTNFSITKITDSIINIDNNTLYKDFRQGKIKSELETSGTHNPTIHGYIYAMYNLSLPGVVKIGCSDAPRIRAKELTTGIDFRSNAQYAQLKMKNENYYIGRKCDNDNLLQDYVQNLNLKLKTSLPSPFTVAFFFESFNAYNDECLLHFTLRNFNVYRGAGTEFFALSLHQVYQVFKTIFPNRAYQYPNFTPPKSPWQ